MKFGQYHTLRPGQDEAAAAVFLDCSAKDRDDIHTVALLTLESDSLADDAEQWVGTRYYMLRPMCKRCGLLVCKCDPEPPAPVLCVEGYHTYQRPADVGDDWVIYNAARPMPGHKTWTGDFRRGVYYSAVRLCGDPDDEFKDAARFHKRCVELDGHEVV